MNNEPNLPKNAAKPNRETFTDPPRWVKISAIAAGILILIVIAVMLLGGGEHGPARHGLGMEAPDSGAGTSQAENGFPHGFAGE
ncbi:hypothetical protein ACLRGI_07555 [Paenarthrobacter nitroguajacolicus]|uniref:hypothetical protein n=1 Tax=Paenarthrobacter nitroguajacolicus TaxID=211146 RepID=UPI003AD86E6D